MENESYSPTFLPPVQNATSPELHTLPITGNLRNQTVGISDSDETDATVFRSDFRSTDSDLQSTRLVEGYMYDGLCETNIRSEVHKAGHDASLCSETSSSADSCSHNARVRECQHLQTKPAIGKNLVNGPALDIIWKGNIEIHDCPPNLGFCEGVLAHPSAKVARKAYSFSKEISGNLHFVMYSLDQLWPDIFETHCPDRDDIALYFYPGNYERSKRQYASLLKFMKRKGLMLRSRMGSVELLVYPSSLLQVDSQQLGNCYFMWGVFRRLKEDTSSSDSGAQYNSTLRPELK